MSSKQKIVLLYNINLTATKLETWITLSSSRALGIAPNPFQEYWFFAFLARTCVIKDKKKLRNFPKKKRKNKTKGLSDY